MNISDVERLTEIAVLSRGTIEALRASGVRGEVIYVVPHRLYPELENLGGLRVIHADVQNVCVAVEAVMIP